MGSCPSGEILVGSRPSEERSGGSYPEGKGCPDTVRVQL